MIDDVMRSHVFTPRTAMRLLSCFALTAAVYAFAVGAVSATHGGTHVTLESGTTGCNGVLPSNDGNTDMRFVGGSMQPGSTAFYEITYPVDAASVGKQFTITDCAFINDVAALKYTITFVPSNQAYVLTMALAVPANAPVGGLYCNYAKTTGSPTAAQGSQRKAGPACFTIQAPPSSAAAATPPPAAGAPPPPASAGAQTSAGATPAPGVPLFLPNTATASGRP